MKKKIIFLLVLTAFSTILTIFITKNMIDEKPKVVVVLKGINTQYWEIVKAGAEKGFRDFGIDGEVIAPSSESDPEAQEKLLANLLIEKPDVLVVSPFESTQHTALLKEFVDHQIPVLMLDTDIPLDNKTSYIGTDNYELGRIAGALLASELQPSDEVALLAGNLNSPVSGERMMGAKSSLEKAGIKIVTEKINLSNDSSIVKNAMKDVLREHARLKGVFATTDIMALGAFEIIEEQGYNIPVIGADGIIEMVKLVEQEKLPGTVAQNPYDMGYLGIEAAKNSLNGKNVPTVIDTGVDIIIKGNGDERISFLQNVLN